MCVGQWGAATCCDEVALYLLFATLAILRFPSLLLPLSYPLPLPAQRPSQPNRKLDIPTIWSFCFTDKTLGVFAIWSFRFLVPLSVEKKASPLCFRGVSPDPPPLPAKRLEPNASLRHQVSSCISFLFPPSIRQKASHRRFRRVRFPRSASSYQTGRLLSSVSGASSFRSTSNRNLDLFVIQSFRYPVSASSSRFTSNRKLALFSIRSFSYPVFASL